MNATPHLVVAIDGPAASGKSTVARLVAGRLGFLYVNSGAMYRAFTWLALERGIDCRDRAAVVAMLDSAVVDCGESGGAGVIRLDGREAGDEIHSPAVNANVSAIAAIPEVRSRLLGALRAYAETADVVMEGRDIGTVVFPDTPHKFYIDASPEIRQARRRSQGMEDSVTDRDRQDSSRDTAPLAVADDAVVIDSSDRGIDEVVDLVLERLDADGVTPRRAA
ncbi:MAG: (d)CMP kinase [Verrucomicrobiales bacterium]|nr:(d)CMP kinase [Verrucomicrobiales bacterium]